MCLLSYCLQITNETAEVPALSDQMNDAMNEHDVEQSRGVLVSEVLGQIWSPRPQPNLDNAVCALASLTTTFLPPGAQSPSLNPRVNGSKRGLYSGIQPITQSRAVLRHLSIFQLLKGSSLLPCQKPCFCAHLASCDLP